MEKVILIGTLLVLVFGGYVMGNILYDADKKYNEQKKNEVIYDNDKSV